MINNIPTPHIGACSRDEVAKTVLMPGDPLRAKMIAETYLNDVKTFNNVRGILGYTGTYNDRKISVMASGMGCASCGIYSYELFKFYDVDNIIRIGSTGAYTEELKLYDTILVTESWSESTFAKVQNGYSDSVINSSEALNNKLISSSKKIDIDLIPGRTHCSDVFYSEDFENFKNYRDKYNCICVEMETFALFHNANVTKKNAACLLTVSDHLLTNEKTSIEERQNSFHNMIKVALESV